jgi:hypothetical protein
LPPTAARNAVRGQAFRSIVDVLDVVLGAGAKERVLAALPTYVADAFRYHSIISSGWYPMDWYTELLRTAVSIAPGVPLLLRRLGKASSAHDMTTVHRFLLKLASPTLAISQVPRILGLYMKEHDSEQIESVPGAVRIRIRIPGASAELWEDVAGGAEAILEATGVRRPQLSIDPSTSHTSALMSAKWQA